MTQEKDAAELLRAFFCTYKTEKETVQRHGHKKNLGGATRSLNP